MLNDQKMENNPMGAPLPEPFTANQSQTVPSPSPVILRGFWRLFADAWHAYWPHFWTFVKINLLLFTLLMIPIFATMLVVMLGLAGASGIIVGIILGIILLAIVIIFVLRLLVANIVLTCRAAAGKEKIGLGQLLKIARHNTGKVIGVAILTALAVMVGQLFFIIPGLLFMTWFALATFVVIFEDHGVIKSISRSYDLVRGYGWETFYLIAGITLLTGFLSFLVQAVGLVGIVFGPAIGMVIGGETTGFLIGFGIAILFIVIIASIVSLLAPIWGIMPAMRYLDLKHIKDNNLPKTESTAKAAIISIILALIWVPLIAWGIWANYQDITGKTNQLGEEDMSKSIKDIKGLDNFQDITESQLLEDKSLGEQAISSEKRTRDAKRKSDLRKIRVALDEFYTTTDKYPSSSSGSAVPIEEVFFHFMISPVDPSGEPYLYISNSSQNKYTLFTKLKNLNDPDIKTSGPSSDIPLPEGYNYWITNE